MKNTKCIVLTNDSTSFAELCQNLLGSFIPHLESEKTSKVLEKRKSPVKTCSIKIMGETQQYCLCQFVS